MRVVELGKVPKGPFSVSVGIRQPVWIGAAGVFFGYQIAEHDGRPCGRFQAVLLVKTESDGQQVLQSRLDLPPGYYTAWGGTFENQERAMQRLMLIVPLTLALVYLLLFMTFQSLRYATLIMLNLPLALVGGILGLLITGQYLSVPSAVGFIALFGVAVLNGVVLVSQFNQLREQGLTVEGAVRQGSERRLRPVLMTALVAILGLTPLLFASGPGSEVQRPLAVVVVSGLFTATLLTLVVLPVLYQRFAERPSDL